MPHGHCYLWKPGLLWLHYVSDTLIGLAYISISISLYILVKRIRLPFSAMFLAFGAFIGFCGATHFMEVWTLWNPDYWSSGILKGVTAVASVATGILMYPVKPKVIELANSAKLSEERRVKLETANHELESLIERVRRADETKTQFFSNVSHELRTPLALILGPIEQILQDPSIAPGHREQLDMVGRNARGLLRHVNDLLDVSKIESGKMRLELELTDLAAGLRLTIGPFSSLALERGVRLAIEAPERIEAIADPEKFKRVIVNLLSNAFKFTPEGGTIRCTLGESGGILTLEVADSGPGVKAELRDAIFERFQQGDPGAARRQGGTGLGLAISKDFVELHGGTIAVGDAREGGASFVVRMPVGSAVEPTNAPAAAQASLLGGDAAALALRSAVEELAVQRRPQAGVQSAGRANVLVVEDNPDLAQFILKTLEEDYNVVLAADGTDGLERAKALRPDLVLSDIMMPRMTGDAMARAIRAEPDLRDTPIVFLTAKADDGLRVKMLKEVAQDYLAKPFSPEELSARVRNLLSLKLTRDVLESELSMRSGDVVALAQEATRRKRELELALESASRARADAEQASAVKSNFLGLVSHEFRTPLTSMQLNVRLLQKLAGPSPQVTSVIDRIDGSSRQLLTLIEELLEYTKAQSRKSQVVSVPLDLQQAASEAVIELLPLAEKKGLSLSLVPGGASTYRGDPRIVRIIVSNLATNAIKYTEQGSVEVSTGSGPDGAFISVTDTGVGIAPEDQERIFLPFEMVEPLRRKTIPGIGLGLALVKQIVDSIGGRIELDSEPGRGSRFTIILPSRPTGS